VKNLKQALLSNKEDTGEIIIVAGELQEQINSLNNQTLSLSMRLESNHKFSNVSMPVMFLCGVVSSVGGYLIYKGINDGSNPITVSGYITAGLGVVGFLGFEVVYNGGLKLKKF